MKRSLVLLVLSLVSCKGNKATDSHWTPPGVDKRPAALRKQFEARFKELGAAYVARTKHKKDGKPLFVNRLFLETSPYLMQHAHNPVDWRPWGEDAFALAKKLNRPVLVSIGYSTCHWCHVMEEESFEDKEIAEYLNTHYITIKVDREERPDVDAIYMAAVQALNNGRGGWPLNVWLTPDGEPFFGGTYFPPRDGDRGRRVGFLTVLKDMKTRFSDDPDTVAKTARELTAGIQAKENTGGAGPVPKATHMLELVRRYQENFDQAFGGLRSRGNKFPSSLPLRLILRAYRLSPEPGFLDMVELTLSRMAQGGIRDHVGGGFHRYSVDPRWLVPHFEKMLYDNALLVVAYLEGFQATGRADFALLAEEILDYVLKEMTSPLGGFYSATDADSMTPSGEREEGYFFTWTPEELAAALTEDELALATAYYDIRPGGNFEGRSIPNTPVALADVAKKLGRPLGQAQQQLDSIRGKLQRERAKRPAPLLDDKILTSWNGLMISGMARAVRVLRHRPDKAKVYRAAAEKAAAFVLEKMRKEGRLLRTYKSGRAKLNAYLEDYAFFIAGLLDLFEATHDDEWLVAAIELEKVLDQHYADAAGGYFRTADDHEKLLVRDKPQNDGAIPGGNSVAAMNLVRLHAITSNDEYRVRADKLFGAFGSMLKTRPFQLDHMWMAAEQYQGVTKEIVIVTPNTAAEAGAFLDVLATVYMPHHVLLVVPEKATETMARVVPLVRHKVAKGDQATAYVCVERHCKLPTTDPAVFRNQLVE